MPRRLALSLALALVLVAPFAEARVAVAAANGVMQLLAARPIVLTPGPLPHVLTIESRSDLPQLVHLQVVHVQVTRGSTAVLVLGSGGPQVVVAAGAVVKDHGPDVTLAPRSRLTVDGAAVGPADLLVLSTPASDRGQHLAQRWSVGS